MAFLRGDPDELVSWLLIVEVAEQQAIKEARRDLLNSAKLVACGGRRGYCLQHSLSKPELEKELVAWGIHCFWRRSTWTSKQEQRL